MAEVIIPREEVVRFSNTMEKELQENDWKGSWSGKRFAELALLLNRAVSHVTINFMNSDLPGYMDFDLMPDSQKIVLIKECVDVANIAMMIADNADYWLKNNV
jgi:hypothetical protein